ncbi:MAG: class I SAM-dependent methyltransferase [Polaribacter sp.]|jgi:caffeoyl-CoA O-methyltransferase|nr:methyltransferase domain-containing protein [Polaribacter sp.]MBT5099520.1 methyltransferase domain-containing protein [Polaribacter sp.]MBT5646011.1 methyltransferase domain-containing protein [Polaribacter sp.]MBT7704903.1 methyltransferase domain-containing protein [Polaribacter sp.]MDG1110565.1 class I SAM-dependent methyltransferase [Polaribacter sp.]
MFLPENIDNYVVAHSQEEPKILQELTKETWQKVLNPRMISGAYQGRILSMISKLIQPKNVLEIGTFTGYSALSIAEGLPKDGTLFTIDRNEELAELQQKYFNKSRFTNQLKSYVGNAIEIIPTLHQKFDLVFIDADKSNYTNYFHLIIGKMNSGGIILSDNVLWYGKVAEKADEKDEDTIALQAYNTLLNTDDRLETVMLPIRDGLTISRVK